MRKLIFITFFAGLVCFSVPIKATVVVVVPENTFDEIIKDYLITTPHVKVIEKQVSPGSRGSSSYVYYMYENGFYYKCVTPGKKAFGDQNITGITVISTHNIFAEVVM